MLKLILSAGIASLLVCGALRRYAPSVFAARLFRLGTNQAGRQGSGRLAKAGGRQLARPPRLSLRT